ncbi:PQQ-binding-like beta-propeller repeat protein [Haloterrigena salinisoli]|uniref:outer membrane protein assembly factor BamB family protein n=1 Tax=Haloterrigena salinisoli TaxID=3132747 RepID=UPI0030D028FD
MTEHNRRTILATGAALTSGALASIGTVGADTRSRSSTAAESSGWTSYRGTAANTAYVETDSFPELGTVAWEYDETGDVAAVDDWVFLRTDDGEVHALDAVDGSLKWKRTELDATGTPAVADGTVFVSGNRLTALDGATGDVLWKVPFDEGESVGSPTVADGTVYVVADGSLYAVDARDGSIVRRHDSIEVTAFVGELQDGEEEERQFAAHAVSVADGTVYAPTSSSGFVALDAASGDTLWTADLMSDGDLLIPTEDGVYVENFETGHTAGEAYQTAYDGEPEPVGPGGRQESADRFNENTAFATSDEVRLVVSEAGDRLGAWDYEREKYRWTYDDLGEFRLFRWPLIVGDTAVVAYSLPSDPDDVLAGYEETEEFGTESAILGIDLEDGSKRWAIPYEDVGGLDPAIDEFPYAASEDALYVSADTLVAVRPSAAGANGENDTDDDAADEPQDDETSDGETGDGETGDGEADTSETNDSETNGAETDDSEANDGATDDEPSVNESDNDVDRDSETDADPDADVSENATEREAANETESNETADESDGAPGFSTGAGLVGGGLTLEWLRRRATTDESAERSE